MNRLAAAVAAAGLVLVILAWIARVPTTGQQPPASGPRTGASIEGRFDVGGHELWISCVGSGSPTVVFDAGLGIGAASWAKVSPEIAQSTRACVYDRAGIGQSPPRSDRRPVSAGAMADELVRLLAAARIDGQIILVGHSYGGMIATLAAHRHPDRVVGLVLVDAASRREVEGEWLANDVDWVDGSRVIDRPASGRELAVIDGLGNIPLIVLTQGRISGQFQVEWTRLQDELATLSSNAIHAVARDSGHGIQFESPDLVIAAVELVVQSARDGTVLPRCGRDLESVGGTCRTTSLRVASEGPFR